MAKPYVIGIDMGGTNTVFGIVDARGTVIASGSIKTAKHSEFSDYIDELHTELTRLIKDNEAEGKIQGIGIGAPNGNYYTGLIDQAPNLPWPTPIPLADMVTEKFGIPCLITNDANAAAIGEMTYGVARGMKDFIMITLGTGVGSGIVVNGQMVYGHDGFAGELGHVIVKRTNVARAAWRLTARQRVWHARHVSSWSCARSRQSCANMTSRPSRARTCMTALSLATSWPRKSSTTRVPSWARHWPTSPTSRVLRRLCCSAA